MKIIMFIIIFLLIGAFFIISDEKIRLNSQENVNLFAGKYAGWIDKLVNNGGVVIGYVVKMQWLPENKK